MDMITFLFATISITSSVVSSSSLCSRVNSTYLNLLYVTNWFNYDTYSLHECVKTCRSLPECKAFNYIRSSTACLIVNDDISTFNAYRLYNVSQSVFYFKSAWNTGPCMVHKCAADERCYPTGASYVCKKAIDVCFNQMPVDVCFRRYDRVKMYEAEYAMSDTIAYTLAKCVIFCNIHHPTYKVIYFSLIDHECSCRNISMADYEQQGRYWEKSTGDTYAKIN